MGSRTSCSGCNLLGLFPSPSGHFFKKNQLSVQSIYIGVLDTGVQVIGIVYNVIATMERLMEKIAIAPASENHGQESVNAYVQILGKYFKHIITNMTIAWTISTEIFMIAFDYVN